MTFEIPSNPDHSAILSPTTCQELTIPTLLPSHSQPWILPLVTEKLFLKRPQSLECSHAVSLWVACTALETLASLWALFCLRASPGRNVTAWQSWHLGNVSCSPDHSCYSTWALQSLSIFKLLKHQAGDKEPHFVCSVFVTLPCLRHSPVLLVHLFFHVGMSCSSVLAAFCINHCNADRGKICEGF